MRLINCSTYRLCEFFDINIPRYAILSHTWGDDEVSFADFTSNQAAATAKKGYQKIVFTCQQALRDRINYAWVDTCCIDKSSSAELSEAINSMFRWYELSTKCYAYLSDVTAADMDRQFPKSRWFTRGWTLQELLAPSHVMFYDRDWTMLDTKSAHADWISEITAIDKLALTMPFMNGYKIQLGSFCVAKRMSWASRRETTRAEDTAYCLLGIFGINMPLLYGEGKRAFTRLQEEIIKQLNDDSILAWGLDTETRHPLGLVPDKVRYPWQIYEYIMLASSPKDFENCGDLVSDGRSNSALTMTNLGLRIQLPLVALSKNMPQRWIGILSCSPGSNSELLAIILHPGETDFESKTIVRRIGIGATRTCTAVVGPRAAALSTFEKIIILSDDDPRVINELRFHQIVVNESETLKGIGLHVTQGGGREIHERVYQGNPPTWDQSNMLLTVEESRISRFLLALGFEPKEYNQNSGFTIFMNTRDNKALIQTGLIFSPSEWMDFYHYLGDSSYQDNANGVTVTDSNGEPYRITATIHEKRVHDWRIVEVNVDAVPISTGGGMLRSWRIFNKGGATGHVW